MSTSSDSLHPLLSFGEFFAALLEAFDAEGIRPCIMRNYEGFPDHNIGRDMDFLILPSELPGAIRALNSIKGIRVVGYVQYPFVALAFVNGVSPVQGARSLEVDFSWRLDWKGLPFLAAEAMKRDAVRETVGESVFFRLSSVHEAILSLMTCLLSSGIVKEKYFARVQRVFADDRAEVIAELLPHFGSGAATRLVDSVIDGERGKVVGCARSLRISLILRSAMRRPIRNGFDVVKHYVGGFAVHYSAKTRESICVLGSDGCGKTTMIESLMVPLDAVALVVEKRQPKSRLPLIKETSETDVNEDSHSGVRSGSLFSIVRLIRSIVQEWLVQIKGTPSLILRLNEAGYHDLSINPQRYGYGGPIWFARLATGLLPAPDLWILLDASPEPSESRTRRHMTAETLRQRDAYFAFVRTKSSHVVIDANQLENCATEDAYKAIIETLARRANGRISNFL